MVIIPGKNKNLSARYFANVIDYAIFFVLMWIYISIAGTEDGQGTSKVTGFKALVIPVIWTLYFPLVESISGQTLGKMAFKLYIVDMKGEIPPITHTFLRRILDVFEIMFLGVPALLSINYSQQNQRVGDRLAGTTVIKTDGICRFCGTSLELTTKEVINDRFTCPNCNQVN